MYSRIKLFLASVIAISILAAGSAIADCEPDRRPVVSLSENLAVTDVFGKTLGELGFLEVAYTADDASTGDPITVTNLDGSVEGTLDNGQYMYFVGRRCESPALTMGDIPQTESDIGSPLQAKGVVGITEARVAISDAIPREISLRAAPREDSDEIGTMSLYSIVYVHAQYSDPETGNDWFFVGSSSRLRFIDDDQGNLQPRVANALLGWVHEFDIVFWAQRQAAFPSSAMASSSAFLDEDLTTRAVTIPFVDEEYDPDRINNRLDPVLKFPVLEDNEVTEVYRLAVPTVGESDTAIVTDDGRQAIGDLRSSVGFDLLFVLDNSESMEPYRSAVIDGVVNVSRRLPGFTDNRVAVAMFGDYFNNRDDFLAWSRSRPRAGLNPAWIDKMEPDRLFQFWLSDFGRPGAVPSQANIITEFGAGAYRDPQKDRPEMGLEALKVAVETANWRNDSLRFVFFLGDDNSRSEPDSDLAQLLETEGVSLVPINVAGADPDDAFNARWIKQMNALKQLLDRNAGNGASLEPVKSFELGNDEVVETTNRIDGIVAAAIISRTELLGKGQIGDLDAVRAAASARAEEYGVAASEVIGEVFGLLVGGDAEATAKRFEENDLIVRAYYPKTDASIYVALTRIELQAVTSAVEAACLGMTNAESMPGTLNVMAEQLARAFLGEARDIELTGIEESIPEYFAQITYLPADYFSVFGERSPDQFVEWLFEISVQEYRTVQSELCLSSRLMSLLRDSRNGRRDSFREVDFDEFSNLPIFAPSTGELPAFNWLWRNESGITFYFVPQDFFPSNGG